MSGWRDMNEQDKAKTNNLLNKVKEKKCDQNREREGVLLESHRHEDKEVVCEDGREGKGGLKVPYTYVNGVMSALLELNDYLEEHKPDIMGIRDQIKWYIQEFHNKWCKIQYMEEK